jgi:hypothetical protein
MAVYLNAASMVSAQETFGKNKLPEENVRVENSCLHIIAPEYKEFIPAASLRRMSRLVKFSLAAAFECYNQVENFSPDAIVTTTGLGCLNDTGTFLMQMHQNGEKLLNPSAFIASTHNAVGGQIALIKKLHIPNLTHTQKCASFESGLLEAMMMLEDGEAKQILVGGFDEITPLTIDLWKQMGCLSEKGIEKNDLLSSKKSGVVLGEGAGFFVLSTEAHASCCSKLMGVEVLRQASGNLNSLANEFLAPFNLSFKDIDLLIVGLDGTKNTKRLLELMDTDFQEATVACFKNLSGCFNTDSSFALWMANSAMVNKSIHPDCCLRGNAERNFEKVLIVNSSNAHSYSFILLERC